MFFITSGTEFQKLKWTRTTCPSIEPYGMVGQTDGKLHIHTRQGLLLRITHILIRILNYFVKNGEENHKNWVVFDMLVHWL